MKKVTVKKIPFKLLGETIEVGSNLEFKAVNRKNEDVYIKDIKGMKVISFFPDINTRVCDAQTRSIAKYAEKYPDTKFISITMDDINTINKWCLGNNISNIDIWSDRIYGEFGVNTNAFITKIKKLARGFIVLDEENKIIDMAMNKEISADPDYQILDKYSE